jgi:radical SAM superfamily enzyme YgiQ (UPF0313 family)
MDIRSVLLIRVSSAVDKVDHPQFFDPCYQLKTIQAGLERLPGVAVRHHDCWIHPSSVAEMLALAEQQRPDLVLVSASSFDIDVGNQLAAGLKDRGLARIVVGVGQGMYLNQESADGRDDPYDLVLLGEPEEEFLGLFERLRSADESWREEYWTKYRAGEQFAVRELDALPFPDYTPDELVAYRSIYPVRLFKRVKWGFLIAGRGCPYGCTFCSEVMRVSIGNKMRVRSGKSVADEMEHLVRQGANVISFQDDSFASSRKLVRDVCEELVRRGARIPWMARVRVDELTRETLELMKQAGCVFLGIGVEAGSQRVIDRVHKTHTPRPWKELSRQVFRWTHALGIGTNAYYVLGNPGETREEIEETIELALELDADSIQVHFHTPYPGSADWREFHDVFESMDPTKMFHYARPQFSLAEVSVDELMELRSKFYRRYLFRPRFALRHLWLHAPFYLRNPDIFWTLLGIRKIFGKKEEHAPAARQEELEVRELVPAQRRESEPSIEKERVG